MLAYKGAMDIKHARWLFKWLKQSPKQERWSNEQHEKPILHTKQTLQTSVGSGS